MSRELFSAHKGDVIRTVAERYGITNDNLLSNIFDEWVELDFHWIFDEGVSSSTVIAAIQTRLDNTILPYYNFFDKEDLTQVTISAEGSDIRMVSVDSHNASEAQPINSIITEITSPTAKGARLANGTDTNTHSSVSDEIKYYEYLKEIKSFGYQIRKVLSPLIEELSVMY